MAVPGLDRPGARAGRRDAEGQPRALRLRERARRGEPRRRPQKVKAQASDGCGCFPTGRHYAGIAHLLRVNIRGVAEEFPQDAPWLDIPIALLDVETTGRDASTDRVVELGIVVGRAADVITRYNWRVNPGVPIPEEARAVQQM